MKVSPWVRKDQELKGESIHVEDDEGSRKRQEFRVRRERVKMTERIPGGAGGSRRMKEFKVKREV